MAYQFLAPDGMVYDVPDQNFSLALSQGGTPIEIAPMVQLVTPSGTLQSFDVPSAQGLIKAGQFKLAPYTQPIKMIAPDKNMYDVPGANVSGGLAQGGRIVTPNEAHTKEANISADPVYANWVGRPLSTPIENLKNGKLYLDIVEKNKQGRAGIAESINLFDKSSIPFLGSALDAVDAGKAAITATRIATNDLQNVSDQDMLDLNLYLAEMDRQSNASFWGKVGHVVKTSAVFGTEILASMPLLSLFGAGAATAGSAVATKGTVAAARKAIMTAVSTWARSKLGVDPLVQTGVKAAVAKVAARAADAAVVGAVPFAVSQGSQLAITSAMGEPGTQQYNQRKLFNALSGKDESHAATLAASLGDAYIEYLSEASGGHLMAGAGAIFKKLPGADKMVGAGKMLNETLERWYKESLGNAAVPAGVNPAAAAATGVNKFRARVVGAGATLAHIATTRGIPLHQASQLLIDAGYNGVIGEMSEERFAGFLRGLFGLQGDEAGIRNAFDQMFPTGEQLAVEAVAFATPMVLLGGAHAFVNRGNIAAWMNEQELINKRTSFALDYYRMSEAEKAKHKVAMEQVIGSEFTPALDRLLTRAEEYRTDTSGLLRVLNAIGDQIAGIKYVPGKGLMSNPNIRLAATMHAPLGDSMLQTKDDLKKEAGYDKVDDPAKREKIAKEAHSAAVLHGMKMAQQMGKFLWLSGNATPDGIITQDQIDKDKALDKEIKELAEAGLFTRNQFTGDIQLKTFGRLLDEGFGLDSAKAQRLKTVTQETLQGLFLRGVTREALSAKHVVQSRMAQREYAAGTLVGPPNAKLMGLEADDEALGNVVDLTNPHAPTDTALLRMLVNPATATMRDRVDVLLSFGFETNADGLRKFEESAKGTRAIIQNAMSELPNESDHYTDTMTGASYKVSKVTKTGVELRAVRPDGTVGDAMAFSNDALAANFKKSKLERFVLSPDSGVFGTVAELKAARPGITRYGTTDAQIEKALVPYGKDAKGNKLYVVAAGAHVTDNGKTLVLSSLDPFGYHTVEDFVESMTRRLMLERGEEQFATPEELDKIVEAVAAGARAELQKVGANALGGGKLSKEDQATQELANEIFGLNSFELLSKLAAREMFGFKRVLGTDKLPAARAVKRAAEILDASMPKWREEFAKFLRQLPGMNDAMAAALTAPGGAPIAMSAPTPPSAPAAPAAPAPTPPKGPAPAAPAAPAPAPAAPAPVAAGGLAPGALKVTPKAPAPAKSVKVEGADILGGAPAPKVEPPKKAVKVEGLGTLLGTPPATIPDFASTEEALAYGESIRGNPEAIAALAAEADRLNAAVVDAQQRALAQPGVVNNQNLSNLATKAQHVNNALEVARQPVKPAEAAANEAGTPPPPPSATPPNGPGFYEDDESASLVNSKLLDLQLGFASYISKISRYGNPDPERLFTRVFKAGFTKDKVAVATAVEQYKLRKNEIDVAQNHVPPPPPAQTVEEPPVVTEEITEDEQESDLVNVEIDTDSGDDPFVKDPDKVTSVHTDEDALAIQFTRDPLYRFMVGVYSALTGHPADKAPSRLFFGFSILHDAADKWPSYLRSREAFAEFKKDPRVTAEEQKLLGSPEDVQTLQIVKDVLASETYEDAYRTAFMMVSMYPLNAMDVKVSGQGADQTYELRPLNEDRLHMTAKTTLHQAFFRQGEINYDRLKDFIRRAHEIVKGMETSVGLLEEIAKDQDKWNKLMSLLMEYTGLPRNVLNASAQRTKKDRASARTALKYLVSRSSAHSRKKLDIPGGAYSVKALVDVTMGLVAANPGKSLDEIVRMIPMKEVRQFLDDTFMSTPESVQLFKEGFPPPSALFALTRNVPTRYHSAAWFAPNGKRQPTMRSVNTFYKVLMDGANTPAEKEERLRRYYMLSGISSRLSRGFTKGKIAQQASPKELYKALRAVWASHDTLSPTFDVLMFSSDKLDMPMLRTDISTLPEFADWSKRYVASAAEKAKVYSEIAHAVRLSVTEDIIGSFEVFDNNKAKFGKRVKFTPNVPIPGLPAKMKVAIFDDPNKIFDGSMFYLEETGTLMNRGMGNFGDEPLHMMKGLIEGPLGGGFLQVKPLSVRMNPAAADMFQAFEASTGLGYNNLFNTLRAAAPGLHFITSADTAKVVPGSVVTEMELPIPGTDRTLPVKVVEFDSSMLGITMISGGSGKFNTRRKLSEQAIRNIGALGVATSSPEVKAQVTRIMDAVSAVSAEAGAQFDPKQLEPGNLAHSEGAVAVRAVIEAGAPDTPYIAKPVGLERMRIATHQANIMLVGPSAPPAVTPNVGPEVELVASGHGVTRAQRQSELYTGENKLRPIVTDYEKTDDGVRFPLVRMGDAIRSQTLPPRDHEIVARTTGHIMQGVRQHYENIMRHWMLPMRGTSEPIYFADAAWGTDLEGVIETLQRLRNDFGMLKDMMFSNPDGTFSDKLRRHELIGVLDDRGVLVGVRVPGTLVLSYRSPNTGNVASTIPFRLDGDYPGGGNFIMMHEGIVQRAGIDKDYDLQQAVAYITRGFEVIDADDGRPLTDEAKKYAHGVKHAVLSNKVLTSIFALYDVLPDNQFGLKESINIAELQAKFPAEVRKADKASSERKDLATDGHLWSDRQGKDAAKNAINRVVVAVQANNAVVIPSGPIKMSFDKSDVVNPGSDIPIRIVETVPPESVAARTKLGMLLINLATDGSKAPEFNKYLFLNPNLAGMVTFLALYGNYEKAEDQTWEDAAFDFLVNKVAKYLNESGLGQKLLDATYDTQNILSRTYDTQLAQVQKELARTWVKGDKVRKKIAENFVRVWDESKQLIDVHTIANLHRRPILKDPGSLKRVREVEAKLRNGAGIFSPITRENSPQLAQGHEALALVSKYVFPVDKTMVLSPPGVVVQQNVAKLAAKSKKKFTSWDYQKVQAALEKALWDRAINIMLGNKAPASWADLRNAIYEAWVDFRDKNPTNRFTSLVRVNNLSKKNPKGRPEADLMIDASLVGGTADVFHSSWDAMPMTTKLLLAKYAARQWPMDLSTRGSSYAALMSPSFIAEVDKVYQQLVAQFLATSPTNKAVLDKVETTVYQIMYPNWNAGGSPATFENLDVFHMERPALEAPPQAPAAPEPEPAAPAESASLRSVAAAAAIAVAPLAPDIVAAGPEPTAAVSQEQNWSQDWKAHLVYHEGFRAEPYRVNDKGNWTIGYGHEILPGESFTKIDKSEALAILSKDMVKHAAAAKAAFPNFESYPALMKLTLSDLFYWGVYPKFKDSLAAAKRGDWQTAAYELEDSTGYTNALANPGSTLERYQKAARAFREFDEADDSFSLVMPTAGAAIPDAWFTDPYIDRYGSVDPHTPERELHQFLLDKIGFKPLPVVGTTADRINRTKMLAKYKREYRAARTPFAAWNAVFRGLEEARREQDRSIALDAWRPFAELDLVDKTTRVVVERAIFDLPPVVSPIPDFLSNQEYWDMMRNQNNLERSVDDASTPLAPPHEADLSFSLMKYTDLLRSREVWIKYGGAPLAHRMLYDMMNDVDAARSTEQGEQEKWAKILGTWRRRYVNPLVWQGDKFTYNRDKKARIAIDDADRDLLERLQWAATAVLQELRRESKPEARANKARLYKLAEIIYGPGRKEGEKETVEQFMDTFTKSAIYAKLTGAGNRKAEQLDPLELALMARDFYKVTREDVNSKYVMILDEQPYLREKLGYAPMVYGLGYQSPEALRAMDDVELAVRVAPAEAANTWFANDPDVLKIQYTGRVPPPSDTQKKLYSILTNGKEMRADWNMVDAKVALSSLLKRRQFDKAVAWRKANPDKAYTPEAGVPGEMDRTDLATIKMLRKGQQPFHAKEWTARTMPSEYRSYKEAYEMSRPAADKPGLYVPRTMNVFKLRHMYVNEVYAAALNKVALNSMVVAKDVDGQPLIIAVPNVSYEGHEQVLTQGTWETMASNLVRYINNLNKGDPTFAPLQVDFSGDLKAQIQGLVNNYLPKGDYVLQDSPYASISEFRAVKGPALNLLKMVAQAPKQWIVGGVDVLAGWMRAVQWTKHMSVGWSGFFSIALMESLIAGTGLRRSNLIFRPREAIAQLQELHLQRHNADPEATVFLSRMIKQGVKLGEKAATDEPIGIVDQDIQAISEYRRQVGGEEAGRWARSILRGITMRPFSDWMFDWFSTMKVWAARDLAIRIAEQRGIQVTGATLNEKAAQVPDSILREIAPVINDAYGGQNWYRYMWATPQAKQFLNAILFAPNWTLSAWNIAGGGIATGKLFGNYMDKTNKDFVFKTNWPAMAILVLLVIPNAIQAAIWAAGQVAGGDPDDHPFTFQNEEGRKSYIDITPLMRLGAGYEGEPSGRRRIYARFGKQAYEVVQGWLTEPVDQLLRKLSMPAKVVLEQVTGRSPGSDWNLEFSGRGFAGWFTADEEGVRALIDSRLGYVAQKVIPMSWLQFMKSPETVPANFFVPTSKGISVKVAVDRMVDILNTYADQQQWSRIKVVPKYVANLKGLADTTLAAARTNGIDPDKIVQSARGIVLGNLYRKFWDALNNNDQATMDKVARSILRVGGTVQGMTMSATNRAKQYGQTVSPEMEAAIAEALS